MLDFIKSSREENIYYGDIFKLDGKGFLVFGSGKTQAMREAVNESANPENEIALDMACITKENDKVFGHFEMPIRGKGIEDPIKNKIQIHYFINMLQEKSTKEIFKTSTPAIVEVEYNDFIHLSGFNIGFSTDMLENPLKTNPKLRVEKFKQLTEGTLIKCYAIPWMNSEIEKGQLVRNYFYENIN